jgi:hypothetical protein
MKQLLTVLVLIFFAAIIFGWLELKNQKRVSERLIEMNEILQAERDNYRVILDSSMAEAKALALTRDSLNQVVALKEREIFQLRLKNKAILDSISNIPPEDAFKALNEAYPASDTLPRLFPFAAPQVKQMYSTFIFAGQLQGEYNLLEETFVNCRQLSATLYKENENLYTSVGALQKEIDLADRQIVLFKNEAENLNKRLRNSRYIKYGIGIGSFLLGFAAAR